MYKELGRKITSLTLLSILLASSATFAAPGVLPAAQAAHNANLFVSAENSLFSNTFGGPMVVEIVVRDSAIQALDDELGEPDITVNGADVRMVQNSDGSWYAYIADRTQAQRADETQDGDETPAASVGFGLDFGEFCDDATDLNGAATATTVTAEGSVGIAIPSADTAGLNGDTANTGDVISDTTCDVNALDTTKEMNVAREFKTISVQSPGTTTETLENGGQIGIDDEVWPFIQLYNFNPTGTVEIIYNPAGPDQSVKLTFDTVESFSTLSLDRTSYPQGSNVHVTVTDEQLNIDPTDEDSWTFGTLASAPVVKYQLFNEDGTTDGDTALATVFNIFPVLGTLMFEDNGVLTLNPRVSGSVDIVVLDDNADQAISGTASGGGILVSAAATDGGGIAAASQPMTLVETGAKNGIFSSTDETADDSNLDISTAALRGTSASITYNKIATSIVVSNFFGTLVFDTADQEWNSGEEIPVILTDQDANKNSRVDEDLDVNDPVVTIIPSLRIGTPFTLRSGPSTDAAIYNTVKIDGAGTSATSGHVVQGGSVQDGAVAISSVDRFSDRALVVVSTAATGDTTTDNGRAGLIVNLDREHKDLTASIKDPRTTTSTGATTAATKFKGLNMFNYDVRSIGDDSGITSVSIWLLVNRTGGASDNSIFSVDSFDDSSTFDVGSIAAISLGNSTSTRGLINLNGTTTVTAGTGAVSTATAASASGASIIYDRLFSTLNEDDDNLGLLFLFNPSTADVDFGAETDPIVADFFTFGITGDGLKTTDRTNNALYRFELEETGDNTGIFGGTKAAGAAEDFGSAEYIMLSQLNIFDHPLYEGLRTIDNEVTFVVHEDLTDEDAPRVNYLDLGGDGVATQISSQEEAKTHSGVVSFDKDNYKIADTVTVTLNDADLNVDSDLVDIYTAVDPTVSTTDPTRDAVGEAGLNLYSNGDSFGRLLDITFDDEKWLDGDDGTDCTEIDSATNTAPDDGLFDSGFTLRETGAGTGIFTGDFQIPSTYCGRTNAVAADGGDLRTTTGKDLEVNYADFRDASGEVIEVGDGAGVRANTGSVSLDRTVYPAPFGTTSDFSAITGKATGGRALFPLHATAITGDLRSTNEQLSDGSLTIHVRVNDPDFDVSAAGEDQIAEASTGGITGVGPVKLTVSRGAVSVILGYAGGSTSNSGKIDSTPLNTTAALNIANIRQFGPMTEIAPAAGIFEADIVIRYTDGPSDSTTCPTTASYIGLNGTARSTDSRVRYDDSDGVTTHCILQGDIITVEYTDPTDASGDPNTVTDSATFDLRNGVLQSDKSVYIIGADMIMTLIEPDLDLDSDSAESYDLDLIEWDSDAAEVSMGNNCLVGTTACGASFDPEPSEFRETGDSTGIFQIVIEIPNALGGNNLDRGEEIKLEYTDWGPAGADHVGDDDEDINLTIYTSNFGATVELDQKVYTWTDKVFITIVAPDHNFDSNLVDEIGNTADDKIVVATRGDKLDNYKLVETGTDTGIFTGEVILTGFAHDADGNVNTGAATTGSDTNPRTEGTGPTGGFLKSDDDDGLTVSFEFTEDETVVGSALIRWNIGETQFLEASYPATGQGVLRVVDPDMNINPEAVDNFEVDVWSDSDAGGIDLTVTETNEATGIFEGIISFSVTDESSGHRLRVSEGDTVTGEYEDNTLPSPYTTADELEITATTFIGTIVPPLERAPASNPRIVDAFGNELAEVNVDQQVQVTADLANGQDRDQPFAYLVQIQDSDGVTVSLSWITGSLAPGQSLNPAQSWTPTSPGTYTVQIFVWESVDNPDALSPPVSTEVNVV